VAVADVCVALATSDAEKVFAIGGPTGAGNFADSAALLKCQRAGGKSCVIARSICGDGERHELQGQTTYSNGNPIFVPARAAPRAAVPEKVSPQAGEDTARFFGTWTASISQNGQTLTLVSVHTAQGYDNYWITPTGNVPAGHGSFSAARGQYSTSADKPNDSGSYHFVDPGTVVCTNAAGQTLTWKRQQGSKSGPQAVDANVAAHAAIGYEPPTERPGNLTKK
jgi:hypothetical protein